MSLPDLPEVDFCETDTAEVEAEGIQTYERVAEVTLQPGDPERLFLEGNLLVVAQQRLEINDSAKQTYLAYARGAHLDQRGADHGSMGQRLAATAAKATVRFEIDEALAFDVSIPAGTRVTPDGELVFATTDLATITAGQTWVEVEAECETAGAAGNGYVAGQIDQLVDPVAYVTAAANTTTSLGGSDAESDDRYRERLFLAPLAYSSAGPRGARIFWTKSAHPDIGDVDSATTDYGVYTVWVLMSDGSLPDQEVLDQVEAAVDQDERMPEGFEVIAAAPEEVPLALDLTYYLYSGYSSLLGQIQAAVSAAVQDWVTWQTTKINRDVNPGRLAAALLAIEGLKRVEIASPVYQVLGGGQVARIISSTVTYGGLEDE